MPDKKLNPEDALYVNMKKPLELRRNILESSKEVLYTLQRIEKIKQLRKEKTELIKKLKVQIGEINILTTKLAEHLPDYSFSLRKTRMELEEILKSRNRKGSAGKTRKAAKSRKTKGRKKKGKKRATAKKTVKAPKKSVSEQLARVQGKLRHIRK